MAPNTSPRNESMCVELEQDAGLNNTLIWRDLGLKAGLCTFGMWVWGLWGLLLSFYIVIGTY